MPVRLQFETYFKKCSELWEIPNYQKNFLFFLFLEQRIKIIKDFVNKLGRENFADFFDLTSFQGRIFYIMDIVYHTQPT